MNITIETNFNFTVSVIRYTSDGKIHVKLESDNAGSDNIFTYNASLGDSQAQQTPKVTLCDYLMAFSRRIEIKPKTRESFIHAAKHVKIYGDLCIDEITTEYLQGFVESLRRKGLSKNTVYLIFQKTSCVLRDAYRKGMFDERILSRVKRPSAEKRTRGYLTESELNRMRNTPMPENYSVIREMFLFSCLTGLRFGDIQGLRWSDVKRRGAHLSLEFWQGKTGTNERVPLCEGAETMLRGMEREGEYVFARMSNAWANRILKRWCVRAGVKKPVTFHMARHTFCVMLLARDVPIYTVQRLMCHSDIGTTGLYADLPSRAEARAVRKLPSIA